MQCLSYTWSAAESVPPTSDGTPCGFSVKAKVQTGDLDALGNTISIHKNIRKLQYMKSYSNT